MASQALRFLNSNVKPDFNQSVRINPSHPMNKDLFGWWLFNDPKGSGVVKDIVRGNNTVNTNTDNTAVKVSTPFGGGFQFDGTDDYSSITLANAFTLPLSFAVTFKMGAVGGYYGLMAVVDTGNNSGYSGFHIGPRNNDLVFFFFNQIAYQSLHTTTISANTWYRAVATCDASYNFKGYFRAVSGGAVETSAGNMGGAYLGSPKTIKFSTRGDTGDPLNGTLADAQLWTRVLSDAEAINYLLNPYIDFNGPRYLLQNKGRNFTVASSGTSGTVAYTNANDVLAASGVSSITGTLSKTNANDTLVASGNISISGTLAKTNNNDTSAASGSGVVNGSLAKTNSNDTLAASGSPTVSGTLAKTNANDTLASSGTSTVNGTLSKTNADDSLSSAGTSTVSGSIAKTNANDTLSASGTSTITGTLAKTNANDTCAASGSVGNAITGTVNYTNANDTLAGSGTSSVTGSLAKTNTNDTLAASGNSTVTGSLSKTNGNDSVSASGNTTVNGLLSKTNANDTLAASGFVGSGTTGTVAYTNANDTLSANGTAGQLQGGGGGRKKKPFKSYDQRQRERLEEIRLNEERKIKEQFGDLPKSLQEALKPAPSPYKRLNPETVRAYQNSVQYAREDDEAAMKLIMELI